MKYKDHSGVGVGVSKDPKGVVWKCFQCGEIVVRFGTDPPTLQDVLSAEINLDCEVHLVQRVMEF